MTDYNIYNFGAVSGNLCTAAIQKAIDECHSNGGGRVVAENGTYITGTLIMKSNVTLEICAGAKLLASANTDDYPDLECDWDTKEAPRKTAKCLIYMGGCENAGITGLGTIDCNGKSFCAENPNPNHDERDPHVEKRWMRTTDLVPARMIFAMKCKNLVFRDFTMTEMAGGWGSWINNCEYVCFDNVKMYCHPYYPNADGIHINCSRDVFVNNCAIHSGDDCIIVRANTNTLADEDIPCENIAVRGCSLSSYCNAIRVAWRNDGAIKNCVFSDLVITNSRDALTISLPRESSPTDIGRNITRVENITFNNIVIDTTDRYPINISVYENNNAEYIKNIRFSNIMSTSSCYPIISGRKDVLLENIFIENSRFKITDKASKNFIARNVKNLRIDAEFDAE